MASCAYHTTLSEHSVAFCYVICHDKNPACSFSAFIFVILTLNFEEMSQHSILMQSRGSYSRQNVNMRTAPKTKMKVKKCAHPIEWPTCLYIICMETSPNIHVLTQPKHMVEE